MRAFQVGTTFILSDPQRLIFADLADLADPQELAKDTLNWFDGQGRLIIGSRRCPAHVTAWQEWHRREGWRVPNESPQGGYAGL